MHIDVGLFDRMVLQRTARDVSDAVFSGRTAGTGVISCTVRHEGRIVKGCRDIRVGRAGRGRLAGRLRGVPVGGPYTVELRLGTELLTLSDVWVGDVWIAAGQSNMQGVGRKDACPKPVPAVRAFYMDDRWDVAREPFHNLWACVDPVHVEIAGGRQAAPADESTVDGTLGPAIPFAHEMWGCTQVPQAVIACAHGGTGMNQWDPRLKARKGRSLYGATLRRVAKNGGRVAGMIWYQGCNEANDEGVAAYTANMKHFVAALRRDLRSPRLPVAIVQLARLAGVAEIPTGILWNRLRDQQRLLPRVIRNLTCVPTVDATLTDLIHIDGPSAARTGRRLARAMLALLGDTRHGEAPIELVKVALDPGSVVRLEFKNVIGGLRAGMPRPAGLEVIDSNGVNWVYHTRVEGNQAILRCAGGAYELDGAHIYYGRGLNGFGNIEDAAGRTLPGFGPVLLGRPHHMTGFIRRLKVSDRLPGTGSIRSVGYPARDIVLREKTSERDLCMIMSLLSEPPPENGLVYASFRLVAATRMRLSLHIGYDGPLKVWIDRQEVFCDPKGCKPSNPNDAKVPFTAQAGAHEVMLALEANPRETWGVFLRVERLDKPALPEIGV